MLGDDFDPPLTQTQQKTLTDPPHCQNSLVIDVLMLVLMTESYCLNPILMVLMTQSHCLNSILMLMLTKSYCLNPILMMMTMLVMAIDFRLLAILAFLVVLLNLKDHLLLLVLTMLLLVVVVLLVVVAILALLTMLLVVVVEGGEFLVLLEENHFPGEQKVAGCQKSPKSGQAPGLKNLNFSMKPFFGFAPRVKL